MTKEIDFTDGVTVVPADWLDAMQEVIPNIMNFRLELASSTSVKVTAGTDKDQVGIPVNGKLRYTTVTKTLTISGVAGTKDVYATADTLDRDFALEFGATGYTPTATNKRLIGQVVWSGTAITGEVINFVGPPKTHSGAFSGTPTAPTQASGDNSTAIATTAFVKAQAYATIASPTFTGVPAGPTAAVDTNTTQLATTAFVIGQGYAKLASPTFTGTPAAPTAAVDTNTTQLATTAFVIGQTYAKLASPTFTGTPSLPTGTTGVTQAALDNTTKLATTAFVTTADNLKANLASPTFTGTPLSTTAAVDTNTTQIATTAFVIGQTYSKLASPTFTGTPAGPTAAVDTNTTQLATTAFVIGQGYSKLASPTFTGTPAAPTAAVDTNTTQLATTAFVLGQAAAATPLALGTAAVGTSTRYARADHVHTDVLPSTATATTQASSDNTTKVATTAFVKAQAYATDSLVVHLAGTESITGAKSFTVAPSFSVQSFAGAGSILSTAGRLVSYTGAGGDTLTLPTAAAGLNFVVWNTGAGSLLLAPGGSDTLDGVTMPIVLAPGRRIEVMATATITWFSSVKDDIDSYAIATDARQLANDLDQELDFHRHREHEATVMSATQSAIVGSATAVVADITGCTLDLPPGKWLVVSAFSNTRAWVSDASGTFFADCYFALRKSDGTTLDATYASIGFTPSQAYMGMVMKTIVDLSTASGVTTVKMSGYTSLRSGTNFASGFRGDSGTGLNCAISAIRATGVPQM